MSALPLDEDTFFECCQLLLKKSEQLRDGWSWEEVQTLEPQGSREGFLKKTVVRRVASNRNKHQIDKQSLEAVLEDAGEEDEEDGAAVVTCAQGEDGEHRWFQFEFHVVFSSSFGTPVLYFRAFTLEGQSLSLEEVWSFIRAEVWSQEALLNTVTQQEHPLLGQAFFMLHPCKSQDFMRPVLLAPREGNRAVNLVLTWLSVVAPLVGLDVPLQYWSSD